MNKKRYIYSSRDALYIVQVVQGLNASGLQMRNAAFNLNQNFQTPTNYLNIWGLDYQTVSLFSTHRTVLNISSRKIFCMLVTQFRVRTGSRRNYFLLV